MDITVAIVASLLIINKIILFVIIKRFSILNNFLKLNIWHKLKQYKELSISDLSNFSSKLAVFVPHKVNSWTGKVIELKSKKFVPVSNYRATFTFFGYNGASDIREVLKQRQKQELVIQRALRKFEKKVASKFRIEDFSLSSKVLPMVLIISLVAAGLLFLAVDEIDQANAFILLPCILAIDLSLFSCLKIATPIKQIYCAVGLLSKMKFVADVKLVDDDYYDESSDTVTANTSKLLVFDPKAVREDKKNAQKILQAAKSPVANTNNAPVTPTTEPLTTKAATTPESASQSERNLEAANSQLENSNDNKIEASSLPEKTKAIITNFLQKLRKKKS